MLFNTFAPWKFAFSQETSDLEDINTQSAWGIIGAPFDSTCTYHNGSRYAPIIIREASYGFEKYNTSLNKELNTIFYDFGDTNIVFGNCEKTCEILEENIHDILNENIKPILIGGEHSLTLAPIKALNTYYPINNMTIVHIDAHSDMIDTYQGEKYSHATIMRRIHELNPKEIIQIGVRSQSKEENEYIKNQENIKTFLVEDVNNSLFEYLNSIENPIYLTIDMDGLDPSIAPDVGNPTPNGLNINHIFKLIELLGKKDNIIGLDVMEVATKELGNITGILASKLIIDFLTLQK